MTRTLLSRSSQVSVTSKRVSYGGMFTRFVEAVEEMNKIVLIPCRLQDIELATEEDVPVVLLDNNNNSGYDMHSGFKMLNQFRDSIVHSQTSITVGNGYESPTSGTKSPRLGKQLSLANKEGKEYLKEASTDSGYPSIVADSQSSSTSSVNTDDEIDLMSDMSDMALSFYHHLYGLNVVLEKLIDTAKFISYKYEQNLN